MLSYQYLNYINDCAKRGLRKAEEEEKWREKANNRDQCKNVTKVAVQRSDNYLNQRTNKSTFYILMQPKYKISQP